MLSTLLLINLALPPSLNVRKAREKLGFFTKLTFFNPIKLKIPC